MPPVHIDSDNPHCHYLRRRWFPATALTMGDNRLLLDWLKQPSSLTARLMKLSQGHLTVEVISQRWDRADLSESQELNLMPRASVLVREVILKGKGKNWVYARSIMPRSSLTGPLKCLARLQNRPLGGWLFRQPSLRRGNMQISSFSGSDRRLAGISLRLDRGAHKPVLWGRRSLFYVLDKPILVGEVFLPDFIAEIDPGDSCRRP